MAADNWADAATSIRAEPWASSVCGPAGVVEKKQTHKSDLIKQSLGILMKSIEIYGNLVVKKIPMVEHLIFQTWRIGVYILNLYYLLTIKWMRENN